MHSVPVGREELHAAVRQAGFAGLRVDPRDEHAGVLAGGDGGETRVFLRFSRRPSRYATERAALDLLRQRLGEGAPAPRLIAALPAVGAGLLLLSYEPGVTLYDLLPVDAPIAPVPPYTVRSPVERPGDVAALLEAAGRAVRALHGLHLDRFGLLAGDEPNPYRDDARRFTRQEAHHRLGVCGREGRLDPARVKAVGRWLDERLPLVDDGEPACFIHYDLHAGNVRVGQKGGWRFRTLLDFELARGWIPEFDLAMLSWHLRPAGGQWWESFLRGYDPAGSLVEERVQLFEMIKALGAIACSRQPDWVDWCRGRVEGLRA